MKFKNAQTGYVEECSHPWLWTLLFGSFYFAFKGDWIQTFISAFIALLTSGLSWLVYPFFAKKIIRRNYLLKGWIEVTDEPIPDVSQT
jgi:hypothetical protein